MCILRLPPVCPPFFRLKFKFRRGSLPPMMPLEFVGCIGGCDEILREVLDLKYLRPGGGGGGAGVGGGGGRGDDPHPPPPRPPRPDPSRTRISNPRHSLPPVPSWTPQPTSPPGGRSMSINASSDAIVCNCGQDALLLTVRKDGPNQGRQFYKCNAGSCNFFLWADQPSQQGAPQNRGLPPPAPRTSQPPRPSLGFRNTSEGSRGQEAGAPGHLEQVMCNCNEAAVTRTVQKDGPNKGRMFHTCGKPREQQCGFFQWADENVPPPGGALTHKSSSELLIIIQCKTTYLQQGWKFPLHMHELCHCYLLLQFNMHLWRYDAHYTQNSEECFLKFLDPYTVTHSHQSLTHELGPASDKNANLSTTFWVIRLTNRQTEKTNSLNQSRNFFGSGSEKEKYVIS